MIGFVNTLSLWVLKKCSSNAEWRGTPLFRRYPTPPRESRTPAPPGCAFANATGSTAGPLLSDRCHSLVPVAHLIRRIFLPDYPLAFHPCPSYDSRLVCRVDFALGTRVSRRGIDCESRVPVVRSRRIFESNRSWWLVRSSVMQV